MKRELEDIQYSGNSSSNSGSIDRCGLDASTSGYLFSPMTKGIDFKIELRLGVSAVMAVFY